MLKTSIKRNSPISVSTHLGACILAAGIAVSQPLQAAEPFLGQIETFGFNFPPRGWAHCDGQLLSIAQYSALFSLLGTTFGGDGRTTFGLPDMRGRTAVHPGTGPGLIPVRWGERGGAQTRSLTVANLPSHSHAATATATVHATSTRGNSADPTGNVLASKPRTNIYSDTVPDVTMNGAAVTVNVSNGNTGGGAAFDQRAPYLGIHHAIALQGLYPSRN